LIWGSNAGARSARDLAPSAPRRLHAPGPHRPPSVRRHGEDHASVFFCRAHGLVPAYPHARTPARPRCQLSGRTVRTPSPGPRAAPTRPRPSRPSHLACMRAISPPPTPHASLLPHICSGAAPRRFSASTAPPRRAHRCAPRYTAPARVQASQKAPPAPLEPSCARALAGRLACSPALRSPRPTTASLASDRRRSYFPPNRPYQATEGESKPHPSCSLAGVQSLLAAGQPCSAVGDPIVILVFDRGSYLQNDI
jgi:hypothetical protein